MPELGDIIGQGDAIAFLRDAMASERMPHAFLFAGPDGVGRQTTAEALGKMLLCETPGPPGGSGPSLFGPAEPAESAEKPIAQACGACQDCRMVAAGTHADFQVVRKELAQYHDDAQVRSRKMQSLSIDVVRSFLIAPAGRVASRGRGKIFIVLEAELMSPPAQNALLKTLEEPPAGVTIILITSRPQQLLATTRSRCALVRFGPLPRPFVTERLTAEGVGPEEAQFWAALTDGSIGRSLELSARGMYEIKRDLIERIGPLPPAGDAELGERLAKLCDTLATKTVREVKKAGGGELSKALAVRQATGTLLQILAGAFGDAMHLRCGSATAGELVHADQAGRIREIAERMDTLQLAEVIEQLSEYERLLWRNVNPKTVWDNVVITCASAAPLRV